MSVKVRCPECGQSTGVAERALGREVGCPNCQAVIQLPSLEDYQRAQARRAAKKAAAEAPVAAAVPAAPSKVKLAVAAPAPVPPPEEEEGTVFAGQNRDTTEMDMTPMIDVTFLLLIFFVVTASFQIQKAMEVPKSQSDTPSNQVVVKENEEVEEVTVQIDINNTFMVITPHGEEEVAGKQNLMSALKAARAFDKEMQMRLIVKAHVDSKHRAAVDALDAGAGRNLMN